MRKLHIILLVLAMTIGATSPIAISAQHRGSSQEHRGYRPGSGNNDNNSRGESSRPDRNNNNRPGNNNGRPGNDNRPGGNNNRPGNDNGKPGYRPQPGSPNHGDNHPGYRPEPPRNNHPGYRPGKPDNRPYHSGYYCPPPPRPYRPDYRPIVRPTVPYGYSYYAYAPTIDNILGMVFGMAYNASLDYLYNNGYSVDGYNNGKVYLRNVSELGYYWEDGILSYDNYGRLNVVQFATSDAYNDTRRFNDLYDTLCRRYGAPVYYRNDYNNRECSWFGAGGRSYVTLQFGLNNIDGYYRYYTTLTYTK